MATKRQNFTELRDALSLVVKLLANKGIRVTQAGLRAYVEYDSDTLEAKRVNIPCISDSSPPDLIVAIKGFIDHEVGHLLFSDANIIKRAHDEKIANLHNIVEDTFIEAKMKKAFAGSVRNLDKTVDFAIKHFFQRSFDQHIEQFQKDPDASQAKFFIRCLATPGIRALAGQEAAMEFMQDKWELIPEVYESLSPYADALEGIKSSLEALKMANTIRDILCEVEREQEAKKKEEKAEEEPSDDENEGDGSGEKESSDDNEEGDGRNDDDIFDEPKSESKKSSDKEPEESESGSDDEAEKRESETEADGDESDEGDDESDADDDESDEGDDESDEGEDDESDEGDDESDEGEDDESDEGDDESDEGDDESDEGDDESDEGDEGDDSDDEAVDDTDLESGLGDGTSEEGEDTNPDEEGEDVSETNATGTERNRESHAGMGNSTTTDGEEGNHDELLDEIEEVETYDAALESVISEGAVSSLDKNSYMPFSTEEDYIDLYKIPASLNSKAVSRRNSLRESNGERIGVMSKSLERLIMARNRSMFVPGFRSGRLHSSSLYKLSSGDTRVFRRKEVIRTKNTAVLLLVDASGSMGYRSRIVKASEASYALCSALERIGVKTQVVAFTTIYDEDMHRNAVEDIGKLERDNPKFDAGFDRVEPIYMPIFKTFDERMTPDCESRIASIPMIEMRNNVDGESVEIAAAMLARRKEERKILVVLSDGQPAALSAYGSRSHSYGSPRACEHLKQVVADIEASGIETLGIGIETDEVEAFYPKSIVLDDVAELPSKIVTELSSMLLS